MFRVGITGGIGSGKSIVTKIFGTMDIPVFNADAAAKHLMEHDMMLVASIKENFGEEIYKSGRLDRPLLARIVFNDQDQLSKLNAIVHPATIEYGRKWSQEQTAPYTLKEAAILFESGSYQEMDFVIGVYAPMALRIERVKIRDGISEQEILQRMSKQMNEEEKMKRCDFVIVNDNRRSLIKQVQDVHFLIVEKINSAK